MFNFLKRKELARIAELEKANTDLNQRLQVWESDWVGHANEHARQRAQIETLVRTIREMDDRIFAMAQCSDFVQMRPHFQVLSDGTTARKVAESSRISDLLRPELIKTYASPKQLR